MAKGIIFDDKKTNDDDRRAANIIEDELSKTDDLDIAFANINRRVKKEVEDKLAEKYFGK